MNSSLRFLWNRGRREPAAAVLLVVFAAWFFFNWSGTANHVVRYYNPLPIWDYWRVVENLPRYQAFDFRCLWRQHNEHRIVFPEIVFAIDQLLFRGRQLLPLAFSFACYASILVLFSRLFWRDSHLPPVLKTQAILFAGIMLGWPLSTFVLGTAFLLQWTLLQLAAIIALLSFSQLNRNFRASWLASLIACGVISTFSSANGLLLWPVLVTMGLLLRWPARRVAAVAVPGAICIGVFFLGYRTPGSSLLEATKHPLYCFGFVLSYLSMPFGAIRSPLVGLSFGSIGFALWVFCLLRTWRNPSARASGFTLAAFGYTAFLVLTAAITCVGRLDLTNAGFLGAKAGRYVTLPLVAWALLSLVLLRLSWEEKWKSFSPRVILLVAAVVVAFMEIRLGRWLRSNDYLMANQQWATLSIENGLRDPSLLNIVFPSHEFIDRYLPLLQSTGKSIFSEDTTRLIGQSFASHFTKSNRSLEGGVLTWIAPIEGGLSLAGYATKLGKEGQNLVLFVDESGRIVGFGRHLPVGYPTGLPHLNAVDSRNWVGFVNKQHGSRSFTSYLVDSKRGLASEFDLNRRIP